MNQVYPYKFSSRFNWHIVVFQKSVMLNTNSILDCRSNRLLIDTRCFYFKQLSWAGLGFSVRCKITDCYNGLVSLSVVCCVLCLIWATSLYRMTHANLLYILRPILWFPYARTTEMWKLSLKQVVALGNAAMQPATTVPDPYKNLVSMGNN